MKRYILYIHLLVASISGYSQQESHGVIYDDSAIEQREFSAGNIKDYLNDSSFDYTIVEYNPTALDRISEWLKHVLSRILEFIFGSGKDYGVVVLNILKALPYVAGAIILFIIIKFFLKIKIRDYVTGKRNQSIVQITEEEDLIKNEDLSVLIQKAFEQKNYRLAIRYYYLYILQKLSNKQLIDWQQEKTNEDYIKEIEIIPLKDKFASGTYLYDFVWYGNFEVNANEYAKAEKEFQELLNLI